MNTFNHGEVIFVGGIYCYFDYSIIDHNHQVQQVYFYFFKGGNKELGNCPLSVVRKITGSSEIERCRNLGYDVSINESCYISGS